MERVRVAIVDVGANTLRLLVAVPDGRQVLHVHEEREQLGLGEEVERYGYISAPKCAEAVEVARADAPGTAARLRADQDPRHFARPPERQQ